MQPPRTIRFSNPWTDPRTGISYRVLDIAELPGPTARALIHAGYDADAAEPVTPRELVLPRGLRVAGDLHFEAATYGPVLIDRTDGSRHRLKVEGGVLAVEQVTADAVNYLVNADFETDSDGDGLADSWVEEFTTATPPTFTLVTSTVGTGKAQRMQYGGDSTNDGSQKVEFYQASEAGSFVEGDAATFEAWLSGAVAGTYAAIVCEAHQGGTYLSEASQVVQLTGNPQPFRVTIESMPASTDLVVVVVQAPELVAASQVDITADTAKVVKDVLPPISRRINHVAYPSFELGTTLPTGWTEADSIAGAVDYTLSTENPGYGTHKLRMAYTGEAGDAGASVQLISATSEGGFAEGDTAAMSVLASGTLSGCTLRLRIQFLNSVGGAPESSTATRSR